MCGHMTICVNGFHVTKGGLPFPAAKTPLLPVNENKLTIKTCLNNLAG